MSGAAGFWGGVSHLVGGGMELAEHAGKLTPLGGRIAGAMPWLGAAINGYETYEGVERAMHGSEAGNARERDRGIGDAVWGGLGVAAAFCPPAAMAHGAISLTNQAVAGQSFGASIADFGHEVSDWISD